MDGIEPIPLSCVHVDEVIPFEGTPQISMQLGSVEIVDVTDVVEATDSKANAKVDDVTAHESSVVLSESEVKVHESQSWISPLPSLSLIGKASFAASNLSRTRRASRLGFLLGELPIVQEEEDDLYADLGGVNSVVEKEMASINKYSKKQLLVPQALRYLKERQSRIYTIRLVFYFLYMILILACHFSFVPVSSNFSQVQIISKLHSEDLLQQTHSSTSIITLDTIYKFMMVFVSRDIPDISYGWNEFYRYGQPLIRQVRVKSTACPLPVSTERCHGFYSQNHEDRSPFRGAKSAKLFNWTSGFHELKSFAQYQRPRDKNNVRSYGAGGYPAELTGNATTYVDQIQALQDDRWITNATRAVSYEQIFVNPNMGIVCTFHFLAEISPSGWIDYANKVKAFTVISLKHPINHIRFVFVLVLLLASAISTGFQCIQIASQRTAYFYNFWNLLSLTSSVLNIAVAAHMIYFVKLSGEFEDAVTQGRSFDMFDMASKSSLVQDLVSYSSFLAVIRIFKYLQSYERLNLLWRTLMIASGTLLVYIVVFLVIFLGYTLFGHYILGYAIENYRSLALSFRSTFEMLSGATEYEDRFSSESHLATFYFVTFVMVVFIMLINFFIAILNEHISIVTKLISDEEQSKSFFIWNRDAYENMFLTCLPTLSLMFNNHSSEVEEDDLIVLHNSSAPEVIQETIKSRVQGIDVGEMCDQIFTPHDFGQVVKIFRLNLRDMDPSDLILLEDVEHLTAYSVNKKAQEPLILRQLSREAVLNDYTTRQILELYPDSYFFRSQSCVTAGSTMVLKLPWRMQMRMFWKNRMKFVHVVQELVKKVSDLLETDKLISLLQRHMASVPLQHKRYMDNFANPLPLSELLELLQRYCLHFNVNWFLRKDVRELVLKEYAPLWRMAMSRISLYQLENEMTLLLRSSPWWLRQAKITKLDILKDALKIMSCFPEDCYAESPHNYFVSPYNPFTLLTVSSNWATESELSFLAQYLHTFWLVHKTAIGWRSGPFRNTLGKINPNICAYESLPLILRHYTIRAVNEAIQVLLSAGYDVRCISAKSPVLKPVSFNPKVGSPSFADASFQLIDKNAVSVPSFASNLSEVVAEHLHVVWIQKKRAQGFSIVHDDTSLECPRLVPYYEQLACYRHYEQALALDLIYCLYALGFEIRTMQTPHALSALGLAL